MWKTFRSDRSTEHLTDEDIIRESDGELTFLHARRTRRHFADCWSCRHRKNELDQGIDAFAQLYRQRWDSTIPPSEGPRKRLEARLAEAFVDRPSSWLPWFFRWQTMTASTLAVLLSVGLVVLVKEHSRQETATRVHSRTQRGLPDSVLSPGSWTPVTREFVCQTTSQTSGIVDDTLARRVFERYHIQQPLPGAYEIDFVIPPALGGLAVPANLWPQPYNAGDWNSHSKDALEERLESAVCSGQLDVQRAQAALAANWIEAYKAYFHSDRPLMHHLTFLKDRPWPFALPLVER